MASGQEHGGSLSNEANELVVIEGMADNPLGLSVERDSLVIKETITFSNDDPNRTRDYGIVYFPPEFTIDNTYPRVIFYQWDYTVANYTLSLWNETDSFVWNITGITEDSYQIELEDLNPDTNGSSHPKVNASYMWSVSVVDVGNHSIMSFTGGSVNTSTDGPTIVDMSDVDLPPLGPNTYNADEDDRMQMNIWIALEPHDLLKAGFYRFKVQGMEFYEGSVLTIEIRYRAPLGPDRTLNFEKLMFTPRAITVDVYSESDLEVQAFSSTGDARTPLAPVSKSGGPGEPTSYETTTTFTLRFSPPSEDEGTDWGKVGRYILRFAIIGGLLYAILWSGPKDKADEEEEEIDIEKEISEAEEERKEILQEIKDLDRKHDRGDISEGKWKRERAVLKAEAVAVMKELDELHAESKAKIKEIELGDAIADAEEERKQIQKEIEDLDRQRDRGDISQNEWESESPDLIRDLLKTEIEIRTLRVEQKAEVKELADPRQHLETRKNKVLKSIRELDKEHKDGSIPDDEWEERRSELKTEAVEVIKELDDLGSK
jgi:hypothetical protein